MVAPRAATVHCNRRNCRIANTRDCACMKKKMVLELYVLFCLDGIINFTILATPFGDRSDSPGEDC